MVSFVYADRSIFGKHRVISRALKENGIDPESALYIGTDTLGLSTGDKMIIDISGGELRLRKATRMVLELAGSVQVKKSVRDVDLAVTKAKRARFGK